MAGVLGMEDSNEPFESLKAKLSVQVAVNDILVSDPPEMANEIRPPNPIYIPRNQVYFLSNLEIERIRDKQGVRP